MATDGHKVMWDRRLLLDFSSRPYSVAPPFTRLGCYRDCGSSGLNLFNRAMDSKIAAFMSPNGPPQCAIMAWHSGFKYFGLQVRHGGRVGTSLVGLGSLGLVS